MKKKGFSSVKSFSFLLTLCFWGDIQAAAFSGFVQFNIDQRFFKEERFENVNGFSPYVAPQFELQFGWLRLNKWMTAVGSIGYLKNTSIACVVEMEGSNDCLQINGSRISSEDRFRYSMLSVGQGVRFETFHQYWVQPYLQAEATYRYAWIKKETFSVDEIRKVSGYDLGADFIGGLIFSFLNFNSKTRFDLENEWMMKDFGMSLHARYLPSGFFKKGLGDIESTGGWSFGVGFQGEW